MAQQSHENDGEVSIKPDCECPKCGQPAEKGGVTDARDKGGAKFRSYIHKRSDVGLTVQESCVFILDE
jgi:hypothetical protein